MTTKRKATRKRRYGLGSGAHPAILGVDLAGRPFDWLRWEEAVRHYVLDQVAWTVGDPSIVIMGGHGHTGERSSMRLHPVIAIRGADAGGLDEQVPSLSRRALFARDKNLCLYCGNEYPVSKLTLDHVVPKSKGGRNTWVNAATSCHRCNSHKADRTPEEAHMPLLALPYEPNYAESLILNGRQILTDQMAFLLTRVPQSRRARY